MNKKEKLALAYYASNCRKKAGTEAEDSGYTGDFFYPFIAGHMSASMTVISDALLNDECPKWVLDEFEQMQKGVDEEMKKKYTDYQKMSE